MCLVTIGNNKEESKSEYYKSKQQDGKSNAITFRRDTRGR